MLLSLIDPSALGRLDVTTMSQQALMECLVASGADKSSATFYDDNGNFYPIEMWKGVRLDAHGDVVTICWSDISGTLPLRWLPDTTQTLQIYSNKAHASVDFQALPRCLRFFILHGVRVSGEVRLDGLPPHIEHIVAIDSGCTGEIALADIPETLSLIYITEHAMSRIDLRCTAQGLTIIRLHYGGLHGTLDFRHSPPMLEMLNLGWNALSGALRFEGLSDTLERLYLNNNAFHGTLRLDYLLPALVVLDLAQVPFTEVHIDVPLPKRLKTLKCTPHGDSKLKSRGEVDFGLLGAFAKRVDVARNNLHGTLALRHLTNLVSLFASQNAIEGSLDTRTLPPKLDRLYLDANKLTGTLDLTELPEMYHLGLSENAFSGSIDLNHLPERMMSVNLSGNRLRGSFALESLPYHLTNVHLQNNMFQMEALRMSRGMPCRPLIDVCGNNVRSLTDLEGNPEKFENVYIQEPTFE